MRHETDEARREMIREVWNIEAGRLVDRLKADGWEVPNGYISVVDEEDDDDNEEGWLELSDYDTQVEFQKELKASMEEYQPPVPAGNKSDLADKIRARFKK